MEAFDKVEELLLAEGYSKEEIPAIMVSLIEQGFDPTAVFLGGIANMLDFLPKKKPPAPAPKVKPVADLLPDKLQPKAPKPEFGNNAVKPQPRVPKPELRPGGRTPEPQFRVTQPTNNVTPKRNNLSLQRTNLRAPSVPQPPVSQATNLFGRLKNVRGNLATTALNLATAGAIDKYVVKPTGDFLGNQLAKGIISATGQEKLYPNLYGKQGPTLGVDTIKSIRARDAEAAKTAVTGQRTNEVGQQSSLPSSGDPSTWPKGKQQPKPLSAAAKDFDRTFAARRAELKRQGKDPNSGTFTWRGKSYNTRLK